MNGMVMNGRVVRGPVVQRVLTLLAAVVLALTGAGLVVPAVAGAVAPYCGIQWGSQGKAGGTLSSAPIVDVRAGRHSCYDRMVVDVAGSGGGYFVSYDPGHQPGRGGASLDVTVRNPMGFTPGNHAEVVDVNGFRTFRRVAGGDTFGGYTNFALEVRARLPYRVFVLAGPGTGSRLVIDVAHRW